MEPIPESILKLNNSELRMALIEAGIQPTPLTPTTRKIYQRKLAKNLVTPLSPNAIEKQDKDEPEAPDTHETSTRETESSDLPGQLTSHKAAGGDGNNGTDGTFYVVNVPTETREVFTLYKDKAEAWGELRRHTDARIHRFDSRQEAERFAQDDDVRHKSSAAKPPPPSEQADGHPLPKQVDLNELARAIENNDDVTFDTLVWGNPRFLISSADGPVPLKPSTRYNALHVAARSNRPYMVRKVLEVLGDGDFHRLMYGGDSRERTNHVMDLYLNTPEKGNFDTPLHMACRLGFVGVVSELLAYPGIDRNIKNKYNETAYDVVGVRCDDVIVKREIFDLMQEQYFVPLMRCHDNSKPPTVLPPWAPPLAPSDKNASGEPIDGVMVVSALAGPMSRNEAAKIHQQWSTPDQKLRHIRRSDAERGGERIGREIVRGSAIPWLEYWDFLGEYTDLSTDEGIRMLEDYLKEQASHCRRSPDKEPHNTGGAHMNSSVQSTGNQYPSPRSKKPQCHIVSSPAPKFRQLEVVRHQLLEERRKRLSCVKEIEFLSPPQPIHRSPPGAIDPLVEDLSKRFSQDLNVDMEVPIKAPHPSVSPFHPHICSSSGDDIFHESKMHLSPTPEFESRPTFIDGSLPSKIDLEVADATAGVHIDEISYPNVARWRGYVLSRGEQERRRWATPRKFRKPIRSQETPPIHGHPLNAK